MHPQQLQARCIIAAKDSIRAILSQMMAIDSALSPQFLRMIFPIIASLDAMVIRLMTQPSSPLPQAASICRIPT
jgi:hypothetical protein